MSLLRLLFLLGFIYIAYRLVRKLVVKNASVTGDQKTTSMVRCAFCDVYIVRQDAYIKDNNFYCNTDHYERAMKKNSV